MLSRLRNLGRNTAVLSWIANTAAFYGLTGLTLGVLRLIGTNTSFRLWNKFLMSIDAMKKALGCSRSSVEKALKKLRDLKLIALDGQVPSGRGRAFAGYRLSGTPECPLPEWVVEAREALREEAQSVPPEWEVEDALTCAFTYEIKPTGPAVYVEPQSASPSGDFSHSQLGADLYPSALPTRTGPEAQPQPSGNARRVRHLGLAPSRATVKKLARSTAKRVLEGFVGPKTSDAPAGPLRRSLAPPQAPCPLSSGTKIPVTYSPPATEGTPPMTPFTDPALGALTRDTRLFYLGLRSIADNGMTLADPRYLKAELFRYDEDITIADIGNMIGTLIDAGKLHLIPGHLILSDPEVTADGGLFTIPAAPKPLKQNTEQEFDTFWAYYPRKAGKGAARKAFLAAAARVPAARLIQAAAAYADNCQLIRKEKQFIPYPSVWLNQERWDDELEQAPQVRSRVDDAFHHNMMMVEEYRRAEGLNGGQTPKEIGPSW